MDTFQIIAYGLPMNSIRLITAVAKPSLRSTALRNGQEPKWTTPGAPCRRSALVLCAALKETNRDVGQRLESKIEKVLGANVVPERLDHAS